MAAKKKSIDQLIAEYAKGWKGWKANGKGLLVRAKGATRDVLHTKAAEAITLKAAADPKQKMFISGLANAFEVDRMNEVVNPIGMMADSYLKNPILLFQHDHRMPIGNLTIIEAKNDGVHFEGWIGDPAAGDLTEDQVKVRSLVAQRVLRACSIGFIPHEIRMPSYNDMGDMVEPAKIEKWELLEDSIVSVPCNAGSIFDAKTEPTPEKKRLRLVAPAGGWVFPAMGKDGRLQISTPFKQKLEAKRMELEELMAQQLAALKEISTGINALKTGQDSVLKGIEGLAGTKAKPAADPAEPDDDDKKKAKALDDRLVALEGSVKDLVGSIELLAKKVA